MTRKYDIRNFYIGDLYLSNRYLASQASSYDIDNRNYGDYLEKLASLNMSGAIEFSAYDYYFGDSSYDYRFITLFYKDREKCTNVLDGEEYNPSGDCFYTNLIPLEMFLPKVDFSLPRELTQNEAAGYFYLLLKNNSKKKQLLNQVLFRPNYSTDLYLPVPHRLSEFYVGDLNIYLGSGHRYKSNLFPSNDNMAQRLILHKNGVHSSSGFGKSDDLNCSLRNLDHYNVFDTSLIFNQGDRVYSISNFQHYNTEEQKDKPGSFCNRIRTFEEYLDEKQIKSDGKDLTIPKALKLYKKTQINK